MLHLTIGLLVAYSSSLQGASPEAALAYLIQIPDGAAADGGRGGGRWKTGVWRKNGGQLGNAALEQIGGLLLASKAFQVLAGWKR